MILTVFERHLGELADGWYDAASGEAIRSGTAPPETVFGVRKIPVETAAAVRATVARMIKEGRVPESEPWRVLDLLATDETS